MRSLVIQYTDVPATADDVIAWILAHPNSRDLVLEAILPDPPDVRESELAFEPEPDDIPPVERGFRQTMQRMADVTEGVVRRLRENERRARELLDSIDLSSLAPRERTAIEQALACLAASQRSPACSIVTSSSPTSGTTAVRE